MIGLRSIAIVTALGLSARAQAPSSAADLACLSADDWAYAGIDALLGTRGLACDADDLCQQFSCDSHCPSLPCTACGDDPQPDGCDFTSHGRDLFWSDAAGVANTLHCDACGQEPDDNACASAHTWTDALGITQSVDPAACGTNTTCLTATCRAAARAAHSDYLDCRATCSAQTCAEGDAGCWEAACLDAAQAASTRHVACLGDCFGDAASVPAATWDTCLDACEGGLERDDLHAWLVWAADRLAACSAIAATTPSPCFPMPGAASCTDRAHYIDGLQATLSACDAMRRDYDRRIAAGATPADAKAAVNHCGTGVAPLSIAATVTCDAAGGAGRISANPAGGSGFYQISGSALDTPLADGSAWSITVRDAAGHFASASGTIACPWQCPGANACDGKLAVAVEVTCNPLSDEHALGVRIDHGSGDYQFCGDGGRAVHDGDPWSLVVTDRQTGACGRASGTVACAPIDPACPSVTMASPTSSATVCEGAPLAAALRIVPGSGAYSVRWLANDLPIPGETSATLAWSATTDATCGVSEVSLAAELTCLATGQRARFEAGRPRIHAATSPPRLTTTLANGTCQTTLAPACPGDTFTPATYDAAPGELPSTLEVTVTPAAICPSVTVPVPLPGCQTCTHDAGQLSSSDALDVCTGTPTLRFTTTARAPTVELLVVTNDKLALAPIAGLTVPVGALTPGTYEVFAAASTAGITANAGTRLSELVAISGCVTLSPPITFVVATCACPAGCDDGDACTDDRCDATGCVHTSRTCDDGTVCNGVERCDRTLGCQAAPDLACDDQDPCNGLETCDPLTGCRPGAPLTCDDGLACNGLETCAPATGCVTTGALACDDGDPCNGVEACSASGCTAATPPTCDDGDACNGAETCAIGQGCGPGTPPDCDDGDPCTVDGCDPTGCTHTPLSCDDGDACNGTETCDPIDGCVSGAPIVCDDGDPCNGSESCDPNGDCQPATTPFDCDDGDPCNGTESCDPIDGCVSANIPACDDADPCTDDACDASGDCTHTPTTCDDGDACTEDVCDPSGCLHTVTTCDDGDDCNGVETCAPAIGCLAGVAPDCDDDNTCTIDACLPAGGCQHTPNGADCPEMRLFDLGERIGRAVLNEDLGGGCYRGSAGLTPCYDLPMCAIVATVCYDTADAVLSVDLSAVAELPDFGPIDLGGPWSSEGWCLTPTDPADGVLFGVPFHEVYWSVCQRRDGATWATTVTADGFVVALDQDVPFAGVFRPEIWRLDANLTRLPFGPFMVDQAALHVVDYNDDGLDDLSLTGVITLGQGPRAPTFELAGDYDPTGDFALDLNLPDGTTWEPLPGLSLDDLTGTLNWDADVPAASATLHLNGGVALGPLGTVSFSGDIAVSPDGFRLSGCIDATQPVDKILGGIAITNVRPRLCFDSDAAGQTLARVELVGTITLASQTFDFSAIYVPGEAWQLIITIVDLRLGAFTIDRATLTIARSLAGAITAHLTATTELAVAGAGEPLPLVISGDWRETGALDLTLTLPPGRYWNPHTGLVVNLVTGHLERRAGRWELHLDLRADMTLEIIGLVVATGQLDWTPDGLDFCLTATAPFDKTFPGIGLTAVSIGICYADGAFTFPVAGLFELGGVIREFTGIYWPASEAWDWRLAIDLPELDIGVPLELPKVVITKLPDPLLHEVRVEGVAVFGSGASALRMAMSGLWTPTGTLTFDCHLLAGQSWEPAPGVRFDELEGQATRVDDVWSLDLEVHSWVALGPLGSAEVSGTLHAADDFEAISGCLAGRLPDRTVSGFTLTEVSASLCFDPVTGLTTTLTGQVTFNGQTLPFGGRFTPGQDWTLVLEVEDLALGGFTLDTATFTIVHTQASGLDAVTINARVTIGNGTNPLTLAIDGAWSHTGALSLALALPPATTWSLGGVTFMTLGGTFARTATGAWSLAIDATSGVDLDPFGTQVVHGTLSVIDDYVSGCLGTSLDLAHVLGDLPLSELDLEVCFTRDPLLGVQLTYQIAGRIDLGLGTPPLVFGGLYEPTPLDPCDWKLTLDLPPIQIAGMPIETPHIIACKAPTLTRPDVRLEADFVVGEVPADLHLHASGAWLYSGDLHLAVTMQPGTTWQPAPGLSLSAVDGTLDREAGVWAFSLGVATTIALGPFGEVHVTGDLLVEDNGQTIEGCLGAILANQTVAGFELVDVTAELCLEDELTLPTPTRIAIPRFAGWFRVPGFPDLRPFGGVFTPGAEWRLVLSAEDLTLGAFTFDTVDFGIQRRAGPPARLDLDVHASLSIATGASPLHLDLDGAWSHSGDLDIAVSQRTGEAWTPVSGFTLTNLDGALRRRAEGWSLALDVATQINLPPVGNLALTGQLDIAQDGALSGCISGHPSLAQTWAGFPIQDLTFGACFQRISGVLSVNWNISAAVVIDGVRHVLSGIYLPGTPGFDWRIDLRLPTLTLGPVQVFDGHLHFEKPTTAPLAARISGRIKAHEGANAHPLWLTLNGAFHGTNNLSLALAQPLGETWQPQASLPGVTFSNVSGVMTRTTGLWSIDLTLDSQVTASPLGTFRAQGELSWDSASRQFLGCVSASLTNHSLMGKPISTPTVGICYDDGLSGELVALGTLTGTLTFAGQTFPITATVVLGEDWRVTVQVTNLVLGSFTLSQATITFDHVGARTPQDIITLSGKMRAGPWQVDVTGTWQDTGAMALQATAVAIAAGTDVSIGMHSAGSFTRDTAGAWTLDLRSTIEVDFGPFGKIAIDGALAADRAGVTGEVCATYLVTNTPTIAGVQFTNVRITACYDHSAEKWIYRLEATVAINGQTRAIVGVFEPGNNWRLTVTGTNLALGNGFTLPTFQLVWQHTAAGNHDALSVQARLVLFAPAGDPKALELDVFGNWVEGGSMAIAIAQPADRTWRPSPNLSALNIVGNLVRTPNAGNWRWSIVSTMTFSAALGGDLGTHLVTGQFEITSPHVFSACLRTAPTDAFTLNIGGVAMTNVRLELCVARASDGQLTANLGFGGTLSLRGRSFTFQATWQTNNDDGYIITAAVAGLSFGPFTFDTATLVFTRGLRITTITLAARPRINDLALDISGTVSTTGDMSLAVAMAAGTTWQVGSGFTLTGASGTLAVTGEIWRLHVQVGTEIDLGPAYDIAVEGDLELIRSADGTWKPQGCITGVLDPDDGATFQAMNMRGVISAEACFGDEARYGFRVQHWEPIPGLLIPNIFLEYKPLAGTWKLEVEAALDDLDLGPVTLTDTVIRGTLADGDWWVAIEGEVAFTVRGQTYALHVVGDFDSETDELHFAGTWLGTLRPFAALGMPNFELVNPMLELFFDFGDESAEVRMSAPFGFDVRGTHLTGEIAGSIMLGEGVEWLFTGHLDTPATGLSLPGFSAPLIGSFCVAATSGTIEDVTVCGQQVDLTPGLRLMMSADLPVKLQDNQPAVMLSLIVDLNGNLSLEARLNIQYYVVREAANNPEIEWMMVDSLAFFATINGSAIAFGFDGVVQFKPRGNPEVLTGIARFSFAPATTELALDFLLDGRWYSPFGLGPIAIENPGFALKIALGTSPIPLPTSFGINGNLFWKKSGAWPTYVATPNTCDEFVTCTAGHVCATHLACAPNVTTVGGTIYFDTVPSKSGFCFLGKCVVTPTYIFRGIVNNLSSADLIQLTTMPFTSVINRVPAIAQALPASLTNLQLPTLPDALSFDLHTFQVRMSTHNKTVFGIPFTAGFRGVLDLEVANKNVDFDGYLGTKGLSLDGRIDPFTVGPITLTADPLAKEAVLNGTNFISVYHDAKLDFFAAGGTVEGWAMKSSFVAGQNATFARKWATTNQGWQILVGDPVEACEAGVCEQRARVTVRLANSTTTRALRTIEGVVRPGQRTHIALVHHRDTALATSALEVRVDGVAFALEPVAPATVDAAPGLAPVSTTANLQLGQGLDRIDDVRLWNVPRSPEELKGQARIVYGDFTKDPTLVARYEVDFDTSAPTVMTFNNSRYYDGLTTSQAKLDGTATGGSVALDPTNQRVYAKLSLRLDKLADTGLFVGVGTSVNVPLVANPLQVRGRIQLGGGAMFGELYLPDFQFLRLGNLGGFEFGGFGQNGIANDFDDGLYAKLGLRPEFQLELSAKLAWNGSNPRTIGSAQVTANRDMLEATGNLDLTFNLGSRLGDTGIKGSFAYSSETHTLDVNGSLLVLGLNLASGAIHIDQTGIALDAFINLPTVLGIDLGRLMVGLSLDWVDKQLCGSASFSSSNTGGCGVEVCIGVTAGHLFDIQLDCAMQPCLSDAGCPDDKQCMLGFCHDKLDDDWPCFQDEWCKSDHCAGLPARCYTPHSRAENQSCIKLAGDHCIVPMVCAGLITPECRFKNKHHDETCDYDEQCVDPGTTCREGAASGGKRCLYSNQSLGQACERNAECVSGFCKEPLGAPDYCACNDAADCPDGALGDYCKNDTCYDKKALRASCGSADECLSGACSNNAFAAGVCYAPNSKSIGEGCSANPECKLGTCSGGKCKCTDDAQCNLAGSNANRCAGSTLNPGLCEARRANGATCDNLYDGQCLGSLSGGGCAFSECWSPNTKVTGEACLRDAQCKSGQCKGLVPGVSRGTCGCGTNSPCGSNQYCATNKTCETYVGPGGVCDSRSCALGLACDRHGLQIQKRCYAPYTGTYGSECFGGNACASGLVCDHRVGDGSKCRCNDNADCASTQYCNSGTCTDKVGWHGYCGASDQCAANAPTCGGGWPYQCYAAGSAAVSGSCVADAECASGICTAGSCKCRRLLTDNSNANGRCGTGQYCGWLECQTKKSNDEGCLFDWQCASGNCSLVLGCYSKRGLGSGCAFDFQCASNNCKFVFGDGLKCR